MRIVGGLDVHRAQITFDYVDLDTGDVETGRIEPATRVEFREWLTRFDGVEAMFATEGFTGGGSWLKSWNVAGSRPISRNPPIPRRCGVARNEPRRIVAMPVIFANCWSRVGSLILP